MRQFSKEMFILNNLLGLHILEEKFIPDVVEKVCQTREFFGELEDLNS